MPLTIDGQANSITSSTAGVNIPATVDTLSVGPSGSYMIANSSGVGIGTLTPQDKLTVLGKIQIQQNSSSNNRIVLRGQPGSSYRYGIDNNSLSNNFRVFREDDVTGANGAVYMNIDSAGRVQMPYQSCWNVGRNGIQTISNATPTNIIFNQSTGNDCFLQGGCTLDTSTGRVTVPVAGKYLLIASIRTEATGSSTGTNLQFQRNGTILQRYYVGTGSANSGGSYMYISPMPYIATASANDYFEIRFDAVVGTFDLSAASNTVVRFMGYLVG